MLIKTGLSPSDLLVSFVYASCCYQERRLLWDYLREVNGLGLDVPWLVAGDFNFVISCSEKKGGRPPRMLCMDEFRECIDGCSLTDVGFAGPVFMWSNNQSGRIAFLLGLIGVFCLLAVVMLMLGFIIFLVLLLITRFYLWIFIRMMGVVLSPSNFLMFSYKTLIVYLSFVILGCNLWRMGGFLL